MLVTEAIAESIFMGGRLVVLEPDDAVHVALADACTGSRRNPDGTVEYWGTRGVDDWRVIVEAVE